MEYPDAYEHPNLALSFDNLKAYNEALSSYQSLAQLRRKPALSRTADLSAKRSEGPVSALNVEMCMAQQSDRSLSHYYHLRPQADLGRSLAMLRCGPSKQTFAAVLKSWDQRIHTLRDKVPFCCGCAYIFFWRLYDVTLSRFRRSHI
jgi:hypothetical protein